MAPGFGVGGAPRGDARAEVVIHLVAEGPPIEGRVLDEAGKPVVGATAATTRVLAPRSNSLFGDQSELTRLLGQTSARPLWDETEELPITITATTGADGWFSLRGVGPDRVARIEITGSTIAKTKMYAMTRSGPAVKLSYHTVHEEYSILIRPNRFELAVEPTRIIAGVVRDGNSGQPLAHWVVEGGCPAEKEYWHQVETRTDADGRYRLVGLPPFEQYSVSFQPPSGQPYLQGRFGAEVEPGREPVLFDLNTRRAVLLRGRVTDKDTG